MKTASVISGFDGPYRFLSNFYVAPMTWRGRTAPSSEHHYNAAKTFDPVQVDAVYAPSHPGAAKAVGRKVTLRPDWESIKFEVMRQVLEAKFLDPALRQKLLDTGDALLIETNTWHDQIWGDCSCPAHREWPGRNMLGQTLMRLRASLRGDPGNKWTRVALTGHRPQHMSSEARDWVQQTLPAILDRLRREHQTSVVISGMALGADTWWAQAAVASSTPLWAYVPCPGQTDPWPNVADRDKWHRLMDTAERTVIIAEQYHPRVMFARNELMFRDADLVVAVHDPRKTSGGTYEGIKKARSMGKPVLYMNIESHEVKYVSPAATNASLQQDEPNLFASTNDVEEVGGQ